MIRYFKVATLALFALLILVPFASARPPGFGGHFGGTVFVGPGFYGPGWWYGPGWYGPGWYGLGWYEPYGYIPANAAGKVKLDTKAKDAEVYVDGGFAGTVKQLGTFPLKSGTHDIELRQPDGQSIFTQHVDVIAGKTVHVKPAPVG
jgi:hypothetical protein